MFDELWLCRWIMGSKPRVKDSKRSTVVWRRPLWVKKHPKTHSHSRPYFCGIKPGSPMKPLQIFFLGLLANMLYLSGLTFRLV